MGINKMRRLHSWFSPEKTVTLGGAGIGGAELL